MNKITVRLAFSAILLIVTNSKATAELRAGAAKVAITHPDFPTDPNDGLWVRALVVSDATTTAVIVTVDAVAIGEIGHISNDYLPTVRRQLEQDLKIPAAHVIVNASHCHGVVCTDVAARTVAAVKAAAGKLVPVTVGVGVGREDRISENRRLKLKNGREADVRHAYSLPTEADVASVGPIDPEIGVLRLDDASGKPVAVVYNFACHPIQGVPSKANTADLVGFSSKVIEENLSDGVIALFVQGCGGDLNPVFYKDSNHPRNAETLGNLLGLSTLNAVRKIHCEATTQFKIINRPLTLPRADLAETIDTLQTEQLRLTKSLVGTSLNFKTFLPLAVKYHLAPEFPSADSHQYLHDRQIGRSDLDKLDAENRKNLEAYLKNIGIMEELTRGQTNLALLKKHQEQNVAAGKRTLDVEVAGLRLGDFVLVTFPGELTVQIGLKIKATSPHQRTFVAGYTNGYIYYSPTAEQLLNRGGAQEDSDCLLAPEWCQLFEDRVADLLRTL